MIKVLKKHTTSAGNELEFYQASHLPEQSVVVRDNSCQLERVYVVGRTQELNDYEMIEIKSVDQVIEAWTSESLHF